MKRGPLSACAVAYAIIILATGCRPSSGLQDGAAAKCDEPPADWLSWLIRSADGAERFERASAGWVAMYRRDYRGAIAGFEEALEQAGNRVDREGLARAHQALGQLHRRLARLHARAQLDYLQARRAAKSTPLVGAEPLAFIAAALVGVDPPGWAKDAFSEKADCSGPAERADAVVWQRLACITPPPCPRQVRSSRSPRPWGPRFDAYAAALCGSSRRRVVVELAEEPVLKQRLSMGGDVDVSTEVRLFDPLATWVSSVVHFSKADSLYVKPPPDDWLAHTLSATPRRGANGHSAPTSIDAAQKAATVRRRAADAALHCAGDGAGAKLVERLGLATSLADGVLRRTAARLLVESPRRDRACSDALELLRGSLDLAAVDRVTYRNEPAFLVTLADAATCLRRTSEAIGALRAVRRVYPEAVGALTAVEQLAVSRLMGGVGGLQKSQ